eukprot:gnl/TRDRNA2_/TRDRNA2_169703_c1_seq2.p1 gnl/TRDRNA2_/TRDRNA2_169703_c1~~gnl/TRDRNA2_/TRDRNA2_169703_c1_seq2.p1  ORF type:complete len:431 (+),score=98.97 gnl/TRDRNA2_/TRDRNA2_169703_c1_seq2:3-1295(+)
MCALFDGQSSAAGTGPSAAEFCSRTMHQKILRNLSALPASHVNETFVKATISKSFDDLDKELLERHPEITDGCGCAVALFVGERAFVAVVGKCEAVLCEQEQPKRFGAEVIRTARSLGGKQGKLVDVEGQHLPDEQKYLMEKGAMIFEGEGGKVLFRSPTGAVASVTRSLGDRYWKGEAGGATDGSPALVRATPQVTALNLEDDTKTPFLMIVSACVADTITPKNLMETGLEFQMKPRAAAGDIAQKGVENLATFKKDGQCTAMAVYFLKREKASEADEPAGKKRKVEIDTKSVRLRHLLVKHREVAAPMDPVRNKPVVRTRAQAETLLRRALRELNQEAKEKAQRPSTKKADIEALQPSPKYLALCKEMSECLSTNKGGGMCGDLGWLSQDQLKAYGEPFADQAKSLSVGQWSDLAPSEHGFHILQRIA